MDGKGKWVFMFSLLGTGCVGYRLCCVTDEEVAATAVRKASVKKRVKE